MRGRSAERRDEHDTQKAPKAFLELAQRVVAELHPNVAPSTRLSLESSLVQDLGLDSPSQREFAATRIEGEFGVRLAGRTLLEAETLRDLLLALQEAQDGQDTTPLTGSPMASGEVEVHSPRHAVSLVEVLNWHVRHHPDKVQVTCLENAAEERITYFTLQQKAQAIASGLQTQGLKPSQSVAIMLPTSPDYFYTFLGVLLAGGIPVPIYPPARLWQMEEHVKRHAGILSNANTTILVTVPAALSVARFLEARVKGMRSVTTPQQLAKKGSKPVPVPIAGGDIAFLQYTSGSTGNPKGVVLTHANLLANIRAIGEAVDIDPNDVFVSWLPLYHDMGLISGWLASLYFANPLVVMSPLAFLVRPERWLWAIDRYRGTLSAAPNFAYELCVKRIKDERIRGLNLSSLRLTANGAEPVLPETMERFTERFMPYGFRPGAMMPVYGLAESTVGLLVPPLGRGAAIDRIQRKSFALSGRALPAAADDSNALLFVACGQPLPGHHIRIVDQSGREVGERVEGRLQFRGPSATSGYYHNAEATRQLMDGQWLDSGDRAYVADGDVYITGRVKDIVIRGGRNIYPHELEDAVGRLAGVRRGCVAVFGSRNPGSGTERLVVLAETKKATGANRQALRKAIIRVTKDRLGEPPNDVVLAPPHTVLKTSSGKIRRAATREIYEAGLVGKKRSTALWQVMRLTVGSVQAYLNRWLGRISDSA